MLIIEVERKKKKKNWRLIHIFSRLFCTPTYLWCNYSNISTSTAILQCYLHSSVLRRCHNVALFYPHPSNIQRSCVELELFNPCNSIALFTLVGRRSSSSIVTWLSWWTWVGRLWLDREEEGVSDNLFLCLTFMPETNWIKLIARLTHL